MKYITPLFFVLVLGALVGCYEAGQKPVPTDNANFTVTLLFEVDGCRVYRFIDGGITRYFTSCQGSVSYYSDDKEYSISTAIIDTTASKLGE